MVGSWWSIICCWPDGFLTMTWTVGGVVAVDGTIGAGAVVTSVTRDDGKVEVT